MQTNEVLIDAFNRIQKIVHHSIESLSKEQLCFQPEGTGNSIAWLIWHLTRVQDDHIAELAGCDQVWQKDNWQNKFNLPFTAAATGYGHSDEEVKAVQVEGELLLGYYDAVHEQTLTYLRQLIEEDYSKIVDTHWDPPVTLAVRLVSIIADDLQHAGQASYVRGLVPLND